MDDLDRYLQTQLNDMKFKKEWEDGELEYQRLLELCEGKSMATFDDFLKLDIRVGTIIEAKNFEKARNPAYQLQIDFGEEIGVKKSSAQITDFYQAADLIGKQILAVVNFPPRQIADFMSEVLVLGTYSDGGVVLISPDQTVKNGDKLG